MIQCPHCNREINQLDYFCDEHGIVDIDESNKIDWKKCTVEGKHNYKYACPECSGPIDITEDETVEI